MVSTRAVGRLVCKNPDCAPLAAVARASDHCGGCLARHRVRFRRNPRMWFRVRTLERKPAVELRAIREPAGRIEARLGV